MITNGHESFLASTVRLYFLLTPFVNIRVHSWLNLFLRIGGSATNDHEWTRIFFGLDGPFVFPTPTIREHSCSFVAEIIFSISRVLSNPPAVPRSLPQGGFRPCQGARLGYARRCL